MKTISAKDYLSILNRIDFFHKSGIQGNNSPLLVKGSELEYVIHRLVPYNPMKILREASRIAVEAGIEGSENWWLSYDGAGIGDGEKNERTFFSKRRTDIDETDADKLACLEVLAQVCECVKSKN